ncbi:hypothetical protein PanWU01x14_242650, partial [Parasponia andersonii]
SSFSVTLNSAPIVLQKHPLSLSVNHNTVTSGQIVLLSSKSKRKKKKKKPYQTPYLGLIKVSSDCASRPSSNPPNSPQYWLTSEQRGFRLSEVSAPKHEKDPRRAW